MKKSYNNSYAVIGLGFGDEGKGSTVNSLCSMLENALVIRYSGGQQAGHTVTLDDGTKHVFSNFGSGTLKGVPTYWSKFCTFDPVGVYNEYNVLRTKTDKPIKLYIDKNSPITTPFEKKVNRTSSETKAHGTCGVGVGATYRREEKFHSILAGDIMYPSVLKEKYLLLRNFYGFTADDGDTREFFRACEFIRDQSAFQFVERTPSYWNYVYEGSQGLLLDQNIGFFPHVTPSNTGTKNIIELGAHPSLLLITRAFQTRHGNGPMSNLDIPHRIADNPHETNVLNEHQGQFKKSVLDLDMLKYAMERDRFINESYDKELVVTCLDLVKDSYLYTAKGVLVAHQDEKSFLQGIAKYLNVKVVHAVASPTGISERYEF